MNNNVTQNRLEQLRHELERLGDTMRRRGRTLDDGPYAAELEYYLAQLTDAVSAFTHMGFRSPWPSQRCWQLLELR